MSARPIQIQPGLYHYIRSADGAVARFHLRVDPGGGGVLLVNASAMTRLNPSGVLATKLLLDGQSPAYVAARLKETFRGVSSDRAAADLSVLESLLQRMQSPGETYPIFNLADPAFGPKAMPLGKPISADLPLCPPFYSRRILERLWELGIPHVTLVIGAEPDETAMLQAVQQASDLGLIVAVRGRGSDLHHCRRIPDMAAAGLDHLDVFCFAYSEAVHDNWAGQGDFQSTIRAMAAAKKSEVCPVAQLALTRPALPGMTRLLESLARHGITNAGVFALASEEQAGAEAGVLRPDELPPAARVVEELAESLNIQLLWQPTVRFNAAVPLGEQLCRGPRTSSEMSVLVLPDGSVIPPRGPLTPAGNILTDDWASIERSDVYQAYRNRVESDTHCDQCPGLSICAADCPRNSVGWAESSQNARLN